MENGKRATIIGIIAVILIVALGFFVWWKYYKKASLPVPTTPTATTTPQTLGGQIYEQVQNPAEKLPQTNPFEAKVNPFEEAKTNPYKDVYKNPFQ